MKKMKKAMLEKWHLFRLKYTTSFWVDKNFKHWSKKKVSDDYLKHILFFVAEGRGWGTFFDNHKERLDRLFYEAYKRVLLPPEGISNLQQRAEFMFGFATTYPGRLYTWEGDFYSVD